MGTEKKVWRREGELTKQGVHTSTRRYVTNLTKHKTIKEMTTDQTEQTACKKPTYRHTLLIATLREYNFETQLLFIDYEKKNIF